MKINNSTTFNGLVQHLMENPEVVSTMNSRKISVPGYRQLRESAELVARFKGTGYYCEVYSNGFAVYDNGCRKAVLFVPKCGSTTYNFVQPKNTVKNSSIYISYVGDDILGGEPWYTAVVIAGEDKIERHADRTMASYTRSDLDDDMDIMPASRWNNGVRFEDPMEACIKKEEAENRRMKLTERQRTAYDLYERGYKTDEISDILDVGVRNVQKLLEKALAFVGDTEI